MGGRLRYSVLSSEIACIPGSLPYHSDRADINTDLISSLFRRTGTVCAAYSMQPMPSTLRLCRFALSIRPSSCVYQRVRYAIPLPISRRLVVDIASPTSLHRFKVCLLTVSTVSTATSHGVSLCHSCAADCRGYTHLRRRHEVIRTNIPHIDHCQLIWKTVGLLTHRRHSTLLVNQYTWNRREA